MTLTGHFHLKRGDFTVDADVQFPADGITALTGPSGSGKTTLLRAIAGLDRHAGTTIRFGETVWQNAKNFIPPHRRVIGYVFQEASLFEHLTVRGNVAYGLKRVPKAERKISLERAIELLGLAPLLDRPPAGLSGGERQRVAIARALATSPQLILMDEPLASLDATRKQEILPYLQTLQRELATPIIYVSHAAEEIAQLAEHLVLLGDGKVQASGPTAELLTRLDLPPAQVDDAAAVLDATVADHDTVYHLTHLDTPAGRICVEHQNLPHGARVRLHIAARDVSLTLQRQEDTSILNRFPVTIDAITPAGPAQVTVRLMAGEAPLLARITRHSADHLSLAPGKQVYAQIKTAVLCV